MPQAQRWAPGVAHTAFSLVFSLCYLGKEMVVRHRLIANARSGSIKLSNKMVQLIVAQVYCTARRLFSHWRSALLLSV